MQPHPRVSLARSGVHERLGSAQRVFPLWLWRTHLTTQVSPAPDRGSPSWVRSKTCSDLLSFEQTHTPTAPPHPRLPPRNVMPEKGALSCSVRKEWPLLYALTTRSPGRLKARASPCVLQPFPSGSLGLWSLVSSSQEHVCVSNSACLVS